MRALMKYILVFINQESVSMEYYIFIWEISGVIFISITGALLHFTYDWSGQYKPLALISAVNESTWEHIKIAFWPALFYSIFEYIPLSNVTNNFLIAKSACFLIIPVSIVIMFYGYTAFLGYDLLFADISIFILSIYFGQMASFKLLIATPLPHSLTSAAMLIIVLLVIAFSLFTFCPPRLPIFKDPVHGGYGIYEKQRQNR